MSLSYSRLSTYQLCPKRYYYGYIENLQRIQLDERNIDLEFGSAFHEGLHALWGKKGVQTACDAFTKAYPVIEGQEDKNKNYDSGIFLIERYYEAFKDQINNCDVLEQEILQEIPIDDLTWRVRLDLVFRNEDGVFFRDFKTKAYIPRYNYYEYNTQMDGYFYYCMQKYGECMGGIIDNCIIKLEQDENDSKTKRYNPKLHPDDQDIYNYQFRQPMWKYNNRWAVEEDDSKDLQMHKVRVWGYYAQFSSDLISMTLDTIDDFKADALDWNKRIIADKTFCKNKGSCYAFNRPCEFLELCKELGDEAVKEQNYEQKPETA